MQTKNESTGIGEEHEIGKGCRERISESQAHPFCQHCLATARRHWPTALSQRHRRRRAGKCKQKMRAQAEERSMRSARVVESESARAKHTRSVSTAWSL